MKSPKLFNPLFAAPLLLVLLMVNLWDVLLVRHYTGFLDNHVHYLSYHLFFSHLFLGHWPLWSFDLLGGMPIWPHIELHKMLDPLAWIVYSVMAFFKVSSFHAFQYYTLACLWFFGLGIYFVALKFQRTPVAAFFAAMVTTCSYLSVQVFMQANGFLLHAYLSPWLGLTFLYWLNHPSFKSGFGLGLMLGFFLAQYQFTLSALVILIFGFWGWRTFHLKAQLRTLPHGAWWGLLLGGLPFAGGLWVLASKLEHWIPVARLASPSGNTGYLDFSFLGPLIAVLPDMDFTSQVFGETKNQSWLIAKIRHELFLFPSTLTYLFLGLTLSIWFQSRKQQGAQLSLKWLVRSTLVILFLFMGPAYLFAQMVTEDAVILNFRNWRFLMPYLLALLSLLAAFGLDSFLDAASQTMDFKKWVKMLTAWFVFFLLLYSYPSYWREDSLGPNETSLWLFLAHFILPWGLIYGLFRLHASKPRPHLLGGGVLVVTFLQLFMFNRLWLPLSLPLLTQGIEQREPMLGLKPIRFPSQKQKEFPIQKYAPFHKEGPAIWQVPVFRMDPEPAMSEAYHANAKAIHFMYPSSSYWFETPYYQSLKEFYLPDVYKDNWIGVTAPTALIYHCIENIDSLKLVEEDGKHITKHPFYPFSAYLQPDTYSHLKPQFPDSSSCQKTQSEGISLTHSDANQMTFEIKTPHRGLFYVADGYDEDWRVWINGSPQEVLQTNMGMKSVVVPAGRSKVEWRYEPRAYQFFFLLKSVWVLFGMTLLVVLFFRARHPRGEQR